MKHFTDAEKKAGRRFFLLGAAIVLALCCATAALALAKPGGSTLYVDAGPGAGVKMSVSASGKVKSYAAPEGVTMTEKGAVQSGEENGVLCYSPLIKREEAAVRETDDFIDRVYHGSVSLLVSSLADRQELSDGEIEELKRILHDTEKEKK